ncbi:alpha/beta hydrolase fold domain-containing protein [Pseudonocardia sp. KRD-184]|uniref:Alpha/beta hydrolase fold domain-containing protein n=1 Tax=Pseudonocardia oceani TaxID=2792013 RepID=A0ABS6U6Y5_9PSEU|nr:alpha/beta hydrolase fold domain-containing protein [Pseudonocardia oceani]MBW0088282.1 alpha/beta hydrolase fold domain-containing protein [Pseudonocardia oceani]MBW0094559.1 alpha/beta hydrolase fold domain-containing protein [Pseudonocardia oceani]MBW0107380.1 alpha/beta hydrolase fold domain-containing protein [Pseudonocardia oceani]MBW0120520.1 alpha/beta hydrolase fold domain-containing protein [Pseudonocardia oceani]MBW0127997.1 alpha/beta hydrolase fold domain-containing protein [Ps
MALPRAAVRLLTRGVVAPLLSPLLPLPVSRRLLDATGYVLPLPLGTRRTAVDLGGVPAERVVARGADGPQQVLYLHGGGYKTGSPTSHRALTAHLSRACGAPVHVPAYRLAPEHPFPAAVDDVVAAWRALRAAGHQPQRIAVLGDSAGGGLVMALALRLRAAGEELPGSLGLVSPWLDLDLRSPWVTANSRRDAMLDAGTLAPAAADYRAGATAPELEPLAADLTGFPPLHVVAGADEVLVGDADALVERARAAGVPVTYTRAAGLWHAYPVFAGLLAEADAAVAELGEAVRRDCGGGAPVRVAVVGAGFGGIGMGAALRGTGAEVTILDRADGVGGVWRANTYPGAACDVPSHLYSFSFAPGREWTRRFAPQPDILRYLERVAAEHGLAPRLRTEVTEAHWDDARGAWRLDLSDGETLEADVLVPACGQLSRPAAPRIPGLDAFTGPVFHSAEWDHDVDLTGRRVAVVGTGASAIQFVPAIVDRVASLTVFQRSAPYLIPKPDRAYSTTHHAFFRAVPAWRSAARAFWFGFFETGALGFTAVRSLTVPFRWAFEGLVRSQVRDAALREKLRPDYPVGCKRVLISSDWYPAVAQPHVDVVTAGVAGVTAGSVLAEDGTEHPADVIVLGTGFATTDFLTPMKVFGPGGAELSDRWRAGARAHLGITVPGFPNLFLLYGPNTNVGSGSIVHMLESQIAYVRQAVAAVAGGAGPLSVRPDVESRFDTEVQDRLGRSVWTGCQSWYRTASGRIVNNWPGLMREYRRRTAQFDVTEYETL